MDGTTLKIVKLYTETFLDKQTLCGVSLNLIE